MGMSRNGRRMFAVAVGLAGQLIVTGAWAQQLFIYPMKGQSFDQQAIDKAECQRWANQQTGYNPATPPPPPQFGAPQGGFFRGAAGGAALGAVGGAIGGDAGRGAAIGAGVGFLFGGLRRREQMQQEEYQMANYQAQNTMATGNFNRAYSACLTARGYSVN